MDRHGQGGGGEREVVSGVETAGFLAETGQLDDAVGHAEGTTGGGGKEDARGVRTGSEILGAEQAGIISRGEAQALALSAMERQNGQAEAVSRGGRGVDEGELALSGAERQNMSVQAAADLAEAGERVLASGEDGLVGRGEESGLDLERKAVFGQERIENVVTQETGLISGSNVEQAGAETEPLVAERIAEDAYDLATEQGKNGREPQRILLAKNEKLSEGAKRVVDGLTGVNAERCKLLEIESLYSSLRNQTLEAYGSNLGDRN